MLNEFTGQLTVDFSIFGLVSASEAEQTELKALLTQAINQMNIALDQKGVAIKVTAVAEVEE